MTNQISEDNVKRMVLDADIKEGVNWFTNEIETLERAISELKRYKSRFCNDRLDAHEKMETIGWGAHYLANVNFNQGEAVRIVMNIGKHSK